MKLTSVLSFALIVASLIAITPSAMAEDRKKEAEEQDAKAAEVFHEIMNIPEGGIPQNLLDKAECIAVFPSVIKAGFIFGGRGGKGLVSCRDSKTGAWGPPLYLKIGGGSFGLQIGAQATDVVLVVLNRRAAELFTKDRFELGGEASATAGPVGRTAAAATDLPTLRSQILSYSRSRGAFAGLEIKGSAITRDKALNQAVYGQNKNSAQILFEGLKVTTDQKASLPQTLTQYSPHRSH
jgi:SH3 domain-containing YSC84-like protein 1